MTTKTTEADEGKKTPKPLVTTVTAPKTATSGPLKMTGMAPVTLIAGRNGAGKRRAQAAAFEDVARRLADGRRPSTTWLGTDDPRGGYLVGAWTKAERQQVTAVPTRAVQAVRSDIEELAVTMVETGAGDAPPAVRHAAGTGEGGPDQRHRYRRPADAGRRAGNGQHP